MNVRMEDALAADWTLALCAGNMLLSAIFLAVATYQSIYPLSLCAPALLYFMQVPCSPPPPPLPTHRHHIKSLLNSLCICWVFLLHSVSTSPSTSDEPVSGGSSRSMPSSTWAVSLSSSASPFSCLAHGTTWNPSMASCE